MSVDAARGGRRHDVVVAGGGPAGLAIAGALAARGLDVALIVRDALGPSSNNYGAWLDDLEASGHAEVAGARYAAPEVVLDDERRFSLPRTYARIDNPRLFERQHDALTRHRVRVVRAPLSLARHDPGGTTLEVKGGVDVRARLVVDATGHAPILARHEARGQPGWQCAFGILIEGHDPGLAAGDFCFMDFSGPDDDDGGPPTFLYAMAVDGGRLFLEETALVARPPMSLALLEARLYRRLQRRGTRIDRVIDTERCVFPLGGPLPAARQQVVPFGAAASLVHPASGFMLSETLALADPLAEVLARGLVAGAPLDEVAGAGLAFLWPDARRRFRSLHLFGMEALLSLDRPLIRTFFAEFFALQSEDWARFLSNRLSDGEIRRVMMGLFKRAPASLRWALVRTGMTRASLRVVADVVRPPPLADPGFEAPVVASRPRPSLSSRSGARP